jgi:2-iminobutanoate/2-iminopropanoate deaminase
MIDRQTFHLRPDGEKAFGYAQAVRSGNTLHISGSLSVDDAFRPEFPGDMAAQIGSAYGAIRRTLDAFGATMANVVKENIYVTDMDAFIASNGARIAHYARLDLPATTAVEVRRLAFPECMIEIEITAALPTV